MTKIEEIGTDEIVKELAQRVNVQELTLLPKGKAVIVMQDSEKYNKSKVEGPARILVVID